MSRSRTKRSFTLDQPNPQALAPTTPARRKNRRRWSRRLNQWAHAPFPAHCTPVASRHSLLPPPHSACVHTPTKVLATRQSSPRRQIHLQVLTEGFRPFVQGRQCGVEHLAGCQTLLPPTPAFEILMYLSGQRSVCLIKQRHRHQIVVQ
jgi:hypothetical protein